MFDIQLLGSVDLGACQIDLVCGLVVGNERGSTGKWPWEFRNMLPRVERPRQGYLVDLFLLVTLFFLQTWSAMMSLGYLYDIRDIHPGT